MLFRWIHQNTTSCMCLNYHFAKDSLPRFKDPKPKRLWYFHFWKIWGPVILIPNMLFTQMGDLDSIPLLGQPVNRPRRWQPAFLQGAFPKGHVATMATGIITRLVAGFLFSKARDPPPPPRRISFVGNLICNLRPPRLILTAKALQRSPVALGPGIL